jgi:hypothetical protein
MSPQDAQKEIAANLATSIKGGAEAPAAKERIINIMAAQMANQPRRRSQAVR